jgi:23S rRNA pseudouridine1911/1915/1917 synthase
MYSIKKDFHPIFMESCTSTMDVAKQIIQTSPMDKIVCVVTKNQTAGRGRGGSTWIQSDLLSSQNDFLPVTLIFPSSKIKIPVEWITAAVGCAVLDSLKNTENFLRTTLSPFFKTEQNSSLCIKWPNDIVYSFGNKYKKICGILCETVFSKQDQQTYYLIGIGLNFFEFPKVDFASSFLEYIAETNVFENLKKEFKKKLEEEEYRSTVLQKFSDFWSAEIVEYLCHARSIEQLKNLVLERSLPLGTNISVNKGTMKGKFLDLNDQGALLLEGVLDPIFSGDVSVDEDFKIKPKSRENSIIAIDFGNSRIHLMLQNLESKIKSIHVSYDSLNEKEIRPFADALTKDKSKQVQILFTSVISVEKTKLILKKIKSHLSQMLPLIQFSEQQVTEENIFSNLHITGSFEKDRLGGDRALKFFFAEKQARENKENTLVISFGTALTCEGVSATGSLLENFVSPGIQMSFQAMNHYTALLPELVANSDLFSPQGKIWDQEIYMQRGVFLSAAATVIATAKMHSPCICYLTGGNAEQIKKIIFQILPKEDQNLNLVVADNIETQMLIQYSDEFLAFKKEILVKKESHQNILKTMLKPRLLKKEERNIAPRLEDFRRIGARIEDGTKGSRIDSYLSAKFPFHSREAWYERITNGEVLLEHASSQIRNHSEKPKLSKVKPTYKLKEKDQIWLFHPPEYEPDAIETMDVIFDDGDLCLFSKPPNMVVHASGIYGKNTFINLAQKMGYGDCSPVHRIDRETSGILACARKSSTRNLIADAFQKGLVKKMYLAVTKGSDKLPDQFRVTLPIGEPENSLIRLKLWIYGKNPQPAETYFVRLASYDDYNLFACLPKTGRTNQIRIHLAAIGQWIVGDKMYHENEQVFIEFYEKGYTQWVEEQVLFPRHMLHNAGIMAPSISYPILSAEPIVCELPQDLMDSDVVQHLLKNGNVPLDPTEQKKYLSDLFLNLHGIDFMDCPDMFPKT